MSTWLRTFPLIGSALLLASTAVAQQTITLDAALTTARRNNRDLQAARERLTGAEASIEQARAAFMPTVSVQGKYQHNIPEVVVTFPPTTPGGPPSEGVITPADQFDASATAIVPLVVPAAYPAYAAAKKSQTAAEADLAVTETRLLFAVAQVFYAAAGTDELVTARHHGVEVAQQTLQNAQTRFEAGTATKVETTRAQLALVRAQQQEREAIAQQANAYAQLATLLRVPAGFKVAPGTANDAASAVTPDALVAQARQQRPELHAFQMRMEALSANIDAQHYRWAPTLSAFGNARAFNYTGFAGRNTAFAFGLQLDWVIFDGGTRDAQRHGLEAQLLDVHLQMDQLDHAIADEVREAHRNVDIKRLALQTAELAVGLSRETLELVRAQYEAGTALQIDLLAAQDNLIGAEVGVTQARFDLALAELTLERAAGNFVSQHAGAAP